MKRTIVAAVAVLALAASASLTAQPPQGRGFGGRGLGPGGPGGPGRGPGPVLHQLNLTEEQREQVRALAEEERKTKPQGNMMELQKQLQTAIFSDTADLAKIEELKAAIASAEAALLSKRIDHELKIAQILTVEQRARARELIANAPGPRPGGRGPGRRGGF